jgi:hypothetical protein
MCPHPPSPIPEKQVHQRMNANIVVTQSGNSETSNVLLASTLKSSMGPNTTDLIQWKTITNNETQQIGYPEIQRVRTQFNALILYRKLE